MDERLTFSEALVIVTVYVGSAAIAVGAVLAVVAWAFPEAAP